jgi:hypothetical protein
VVAGRGIDAPPQSAAGAQAWPRRGPLRHRTAAGRRAR